MKETNVSLVAFYGDKPPQLANLIDRLQTYLAQHQLTKDKFVAYQMAQVHATIIGCEGFKTPQGIASQWYQERRGETKRINFATLTNYLQQQVNLPFTIRLGGYDRQGDYSFLSRNRHPYERSIQLQPAGEVTIPILIGWSWQNSIITLEIDQLRHNFQQFNLLHKYHGTPDAVDNDFYLRLGTIEAQLSTEEIEIISLELRQFLETQPVDIAIEPENIAFAQYQDLQLTPATTNIISITEITASQLEQLYSTFHTF